MCDLLEGAFKSLNHLHRQISYETYSIQQCNLYSRGQNDAILLHWYFLEVVVSVSKSMSLLLTSYFFIKQFIKADLPTLVYPTSATTGILLPRFFALSCLILRRRVSSSISLLIFAYLSRNCLLSNYSCDSPSPPSVRTALRCLAEMTSIATYWAWIRSPQKIFRFDEYVAPSRTSLVLKQLRKLS